MTQAKDALKQIQQARDAVGQLSALDRQLRMRHAESLAERARVMNSLEPLQTVIDRMCTSVDETANAWAVQNGTAVLLAFSARLGEDNQVHNPEGWRYMPDFSFHDLCGLMPTLVKARLEAIIRTRAGECNGLPISERPAALAAIDAKVAAIEQQHTELWEVARSADPPIAMDLLPRVRAAREQQARREQLAAAAREREAALDRHVAAQPTPHFTRSEYLADRTGDPRLP